METVDRIKQQIEENPILLYMKELRRENYGI